MTLAEEGLEAAEKIMEFRRLKDPVELLITDIRMPGLDGFTLIDKLRTAGVSIPVICMTGYKTCDFIANLKCRDCKYFVIKPFSLLELMDMVKEVLLESGSGDDKKKNSPGRPEKDGLPAAAGDTGKLIKEYFNTGREFNGRVKKCLCT